MFKRIFLPLLAACLLVPHVAFGHNLWLNATDFSPEPSARTGAHTKIYFGFGHRFPVHDFLDKTKLVEFKLNKPGGGARDLEAEDGGFLATPLVLKKEGGYVVSAATHSGYYTMYRDKGRIKHKLGNKEGLENVILSLYYENYTKALVNVGNTEDNAYVTPVGHGIEIVPMENPYLKKVGDTLKLKVLHKGRPASFCPVNATYVGFSPREEFAFANKTNGKGISTVRIVHPGHWIVLAVVRKPAPESEKDKCLEMKYSASLSFEIP